MGQKYWLEQQASFSIFFNLCLHWKDISTALKKALRVKAYFRLRRTESSRSHHHLGHTGIHLSSCFLWLWTDCRYPWMWCFDLNVKDSWCFVLNKYLSLPVLSLFVLELVLAYNVPVQASHRGQVALRKIITSNSSLVSWCFVTAEVFHIHGVAMFESSRDVAAHSGWL